MQILTESEFNRHLSAPSAGYLFFGEEDYTKLHAISRLRDAICLDPSAAVFNDIRMSALDYTPARLLDALEPPPMLGERKIITVSGLDLCSMRADELSDLCDVLATLQNYDYNTLVLSVPADGIDEGRLPSKPSALLTRLAEFLIPVRFVRITPARLAGWVGKHFEHWGVSASPELCARVVDYCGASMFTLAGEVQKMSFYVLSDGRAELRAADITDAAVPDRSYDAFAFANAVTAGDRQRALNILAEMKRQRIEPTIIMGDISRVFCDMLTVRQLSDDGMRAPAIAKVTHIHEYRVGLYLAGASQITADRLRDIVLRCAEADVAVKLAGRAYEPIERLICGL